MKINSTNILGIIITGCIMFGIIYLIYLSMSGEPDYSNQRDSYDGSNRSIYP